MSSLNAPRKFGILGGGPDAKEVLDGEDHRRDSFDDIHDLVREPRLERLDCSETRGEDGEEDEKKDDELNDPADRAAPIKNVEDHLAQGRLLPRRRGGAQRNETA